jgi:hypothetical protein
MPKELIGRVAKIEDAEEHLRDYYTKEVIEGKETGFFVVNIPEQGGYAFENVMSLKTAASRERENNEQLRNKLNAFKNDKGELLDAVAVNSELTELRKLRDGAPDSDKEREKWANKERELTAAWQSKFDTQKADNEKLDTENRSLLVTHNARAALARSGVTSEWEDILLGHMEKVMQVKESTDGRRVVRIMGDGGIELPSMQPGSTAPMDPDEYVKRNLVPKYSAAFKAPDVAGSGAPGGDKGEGGAGGNVGPHQISRDDSRNPVEYQRAKAAAEKAGAELEIVE